MNQIYPKVFISYSWDSPEHQNQVLQLSDRLRSEGVDCQIDQYEDFPSEGWPRWMENQLEWATFVLVICTKHYCQRFRGQNEAGKGKGVTWEGAIIAQELYNGYVNNTKFIPVIFSPQDSGHIPVILSSFSRYVLDLEEGYEKLYRYLTSQQATPKTELGKLRTLPLRERKQDFVEASEEKKDYITQGSVTEKDKIVSKLIDKLFDALYSHKIELEIQKFKMIAHKSLFLNGEIEQRFIKNNFSSSFAVANRYKRPTQIIYSKPGRTKVGLRGNKEEGKEIIYFIARNDNLGGLPGEVRIFFPANNEIAKISGLSL
ncbi:MAG: SEFIR domain-containing protein [Nostoc sp. ChiQUE02]|uniref:SEFIR domain-containing protein n=1 Tax=Nostoc sp. ChiQUE02 TaxID=3075377 RepID=UPI002AD1D9CA|nr:SEFIR domain-containing protein [Nostoc sp. ChiQUE02]MDZ8231019.1 SEFIR domain-containing protein [Nostoc sp. ChiQUE02]